MNRIGYLVPFSLIKCSKEHLQVCCFLAEKFCHLHYSEYGKEVMVNLIAQKSNVARILTALLILHNKKGIAQIDSVSFGEDLNELFGDAIFYRKQNSNFTLFSKTEIIKNVFPKLLISKLFRLFSDFSADYPTVIRSWVDVDERLHKDDFNQANIWIYPFGLNIRRSISFIKRCKLTYPRVSLMGIPYSIKDFLMLIFSKQRNLSYRILIFEYEAFKKHSLELEPFDRVLTSDEYQPATYVLYKRLKDTFVHNKAHGIGCYNPYVAYDKFSVLNSVQASFYQCFNTLDFDVKYSEKEMAIENSFDTIIFVDQGDLTEYGYFYEDRLNRETICKLKSYANSARMNFFIKAHPNRSKKSSQQLERSYGVVVLSDISFLDSTPVFISLYSSAYFEFRKHGSFFFVKDELFDSSVLFGENILQLDFNTLETELNDFRILSR